MRAILDARNKKTLEKLWRLSKTTPAILNDIEWVLACFAIRLFLQAGGRPGAQEREVLKSYLAGELPLGATAEKLVADLIGARTDAVGRLKALSAVLALPVYYNEGEDVLGSVYISLKNISERKGTGAYYTPGHVIQRVVARLGEERGLQERASVLDPSCGTGRFLLWLAGQGKPVDTLHGKDIDSRSVKITRINLALQDKAADAQVLYKNLRVENSLLSGNEEEFDLIVGNPPWGSRYNPRDRASLLKSYRCAKNRGMESYALFVEYALNHLKEGGRTSLLLPESILNVSAHKPVRTVILDRAQLCSVDYLGNCFKRVQCPAVILTMERGGPGKDTEQIQITTREGGHLLSGGKALDPNGFTFLASDREAELLEFLDEMPGAVFLKGNADFALGIVTGDNNRHLTGQQEKGRERILRGKNIFKYRIVPPELFTASEVSSFQQVAPMKYYRAKEKLMYRFIGRHLVFAYDDTQTLSLNSCNVLIPRLRGLQMKYLLAVLNSSVVQFYHRKKFNSLKVLRSHLEMIPLPAAPPEVQDEIVRLVEELEEQRQPDKRKALFHEIDGRVSAAYALSAGDESYLRQLSLHDDRNL